MIEVPTTVPKDLFEQNAAYGQRKLKRPSRAKARKAAQQVLIIFVGERGSSEAVKVSSATEIESALAVATGHLHHD